MSDVDMSGHFHWQQTYCYTNIIIFCIVFASLELIIALNSTVLCTF